jgi:hypothetical protein
VAECVRSGAGRHVDIEDAQGRELEAEWRPLHHQPLVHSPGALTQILKSQCPSICTNINDMYNNDVGKGGVRVYEAYEVK